MDHEYTPHQCIFEDILQKHHQWHEVERAKAEYKEIFHERECVDKIREAVEIEEAKLGVHGWHTWVCNHVPPQFFENLPQGRECSYEDLSSSKFDIGYTSCRFNDILLVHDAWHELAVNLAKNNPEKLNDIPVQCVTRMRWAVTLGDISLRVDDYFRRVLSQPQATVATPTGQPDEEELPPNQIQTDFVGEEVPFNELTGPLDESHSDHLSDLESHFFRAPSNVIMTQTSDEHQSNVSMSTTSASSHQSMSLEHHLGTQHHSIEVVTILSDGSASDDDQSDGSMASATESGESEQVRPLKRMRHLETENLHGNKRSRRTEIQQPGTGDPQHLIQAEQPHQTEPVRHVATELLPPVDNWVSRVMESTGPVENQSHSEHRSPRQPLGLLRPGIFNALRLLCAAVLYEYYTLAAYGYVRDRPLPPIELEFMPVFWSTLLAAMLSDLYLYHIIAFTRRPPR